MTSQTEQITVNFHGKLHVFNFAENTTLCDLSTPIHEQLDVPPQTQKLLIAPKPGMVKAPFPSTPISSLPLDSPRFKITLLGSTTTELQSLNAASEEASRRNQPRRYGVKPVSAYSSSKSSYTTSKTQPPQYTFHILKPLPYLPRPERSHAFLQRLRDDPGVRSTMRKHQFSVPLLTEMDPIMHTTMESRTLGLNRNRGEAIELRLRTDAYDGYRDYRTIRRTLCHELAHCVFGEHDRNFWALTRQIEREVDAGDYWGGGRQLSDQEFYNPRDWQEEANKIDTADHGGWTGGEFVLGGADGRDNVNMDDAGARGLSRREILAKAAEARLTKKGGIDERHWQQQSPSQQQRER